MKLKRRSGVPSDLFLGSMADVTFLLVIFFMVTSVLAVARGLDLALPEKIDDVDIVEPEEAVDVHVLASGALEVDGRPMAVEDILAYLEPKLEANPDKPVILRTDADAPYGAMMTVLDELRQSPDKRGWEIANLAIPTLSEQQSWW